MDRNNCVIPVWYIRIGNFISFEQAYSMAERIQGFCNLSKGEIDVSQKFLTLSKEKYENITRK